MNKEINTITLKGKLLQPEWSYTDDNGVLHYSAILEIKRSEEVKDYIPIYLDETLFNQIPKGINFVEIIGSIKFQKLRKNMAIFVLATTLKKLEKEEYENTLQLIGVFSKRCSSKNKKNKAYVSKSYLTVNDCYSIPIFAWKNTSQKLSTLSAGTDICITGKLQNKRRVKSFDIDSNNSHCSFRINVSAFSLFS